MGCILVRLMKCKMQNATCKFWYPVLQDEFYKSVVKPRKDTANDTLILHFDFLILI